MRKFVLTTMQNRRKEILLKELLRWELIVAQKFKGRSMNLERDKILKQKYEVQEGNSAGKNRG